MLVGTTIHPLRLLVKLLANNTPREKVALSLFSDRGHQIPSPQHPWSLHLSIPGVSLDLPTASGQANHSLPATLQTWVSMAFFWFSSDFPASWVCSSSSSGSEVLGFPDLCSDPCHSRACGSHCLGCSCCSDFARMNQLCSADVLVQTFQISKAELGSLQACSVLTL